MMELSKVIHNTIPALLKAHNVPGAAVALLQPESAVWAQGFGFADKERTRPIGCDTLFQVGSISKTLTAWGIMKLVEKGRIGLDEPAENYLTRWHLPASGFDNAGITIRRLLTHTAGFPNNVYLGTPYGAGLPKTEESLSRTNLFGDACGRLVSEPGSKFQYTGYGYTILQLIMEEVTGESFSGFMEREILKPLGMQRSTFEWSPDTANKASKAYSAFGKVLPEYVFTEKAAAGLYSSAVDMARFLEENIRGISGEPEGSGVLSPETIKLMHSRVERNIGYGIGYIIAALPNNNKVLFHDGINRGWHSQFAFLPKKGEGIVIMTNSNNGCSLISDVMNIWLEHTVGPISHHYQKILRLKTSNRYIIALADKWNCIKYACLL